MVWYDMIWYDMVWHGNGMVWYGMIWYGMVQHDMVWRDPPSIWASFQPPTQHCVPERSIFSTIYGTFNSARELMRPYVLDGWYIMQDNGMLLALLYTVSFIPPYQITYNACNISGTNIIHHQISASSRIKFRPEDTSLTWSSSCIWTMGSQPACFTSLW